MTDVERLNESAYVTAMRYMEEDSAALSATIPISLDGGRAMFTGYVDTTGFPREDDADVLAAAIIAIKRVRVAAIEQGLEVD